MEQPVSCFVIFTRVSIFSKITTCKLIHSMLALIINRLSHVSIGRIISESGRHVWALFYDSNVHTVSIPLTLSFSPTNLPLSVLVGSLCQRRSVHLRAQVPRRGGYSRAAGMSVDAGCGILCAMAVGVAQRGTKLAYNVLESKSTSCRLPSIWLRSLDYHRCIFHRPHARVLDGESHFSRSVCAVSMSCAISMDARQYCSLQREIKVQISQA